MRVDQREFAADRLAKFVPTPDEIRRSCLAIQATWPEAERRKRALHLTQAETVELPTVRVRDLVGGSQSGD